MNQEKLSARHLYNNVVEVSIANADGDSKRQMRQIDSLAESGVDLLVVAPNEYEAVTPAIVKARKKGILVVLFDRKVDTNDYTAYIGGDTIEAGSAMGHYALSLVREHFSLPTPSFSRRVGVNLESRDRSPLFLGVDDNADMRRYLRTLLTDKCACRKPIPFYSIPTTPSPKSPMTPVSVPPATSPPALRSSMGSIRRKCALNCTIQECMRN